MYMYLINRFVQTQKDLVKNTLYTYAINMCVCIYTLIADKFVTFLKREKPLI